MTSVGRNLFPWVAVIGMGVATVWAISFGTLPPADFTFVNGTEVQSIDPAVVTGQPEGRIIQALFEGLVAWHPQTLEPIPGVAQSWEISEDKRRYTFHLRRTARWSDGTRVTAGDFEYSFRRFLDPLTAAEYAYQLWYVTNAKKYSSGVRHLRRGDRVEVELNRQPDPSDPRPYARGRVLKGRLLSEHHVQSKGTNGVDAGKTGEETLEPAEPFLVEIDGVVRRFKRTKVAGEDVECCAQILFDFDQVGIKALDDDTLQITLEHPTPYFLGLLGFYPLSPVNQKCLETHGVPTWTRPENLIGNGAFRLKFRRIRDRIRLVRSDTYWNRDNVRLEVIDALAVESNTTALNLYLTGKADWIPTVPSAVIPELLRQDRPDFQPQLELTIYYYRLNTTKAGLNQTLVRRALNLAMNKQQIVDTVMQAGETPARSFVPPGLPDYVPALCGDHDPALARRLLAEAGYPDGQGLGKIEIMYNADESHAAIAQLIKAQWETELGITVGLRQQEWNAYQTDQRLLNYWVARAGWIGDYADANTFLDMWVTGGANNQTGWGDPQYDKLIREAASEPDPQRRLEQLRQAERILMDEMPVLPIFYRVSKNMVRPYVKGFFNTLQDVHPLWSISIDQQQRQRLFAEEGLR